VNGSNLKLGTAAGASADSPRSSSQRWAAIADVWIAIVIGIFVAVRILGSALAERILHSLAHH
jgi:hypothetical protein